MKTIAFYLPQFHTIPENDKWWGEGYTEWTAVKSAKQLYEGHYQPKIPYKNRYYNLLKKDTLEWQASLMKAYGVDGLCFYHYYFEGGKRVLEKPAENLLKWTDVDMPFCFSWANETWARTWSAIGTKNVWNSIEEKKEQGNDKNNGILLKQEYGTEEDWRIHFEYLLPFFKDDRYIRHSNSPIFVIHRADMIPCLPQMMELWNNLAKENGFDGVYFIGSNSSVIGMDSYVRQEANYSDTINELKISYSDMSKLVIKNALSADDKTYLCGFPGYDDTPRRGTNGKIIADSSPEQFYEMMRILYAISAERNHEYIFINAWNEWGEGMYLEPDTVYKYAYLEALKKARYNGELPSISEIEKRYSLDFEMLNRLQTEVNKYKEHSRVMGRMACLGNINERIDRYIKDNSINSIAIYGMGDIAKVIILHIQNERIRYIIDKNYRRVKSSYPIYGIEEKLPDVDLIIVSLPTLFNVVYKDLVRITNATIISIDAFLDELE